MNALFMVPSTGTVAWWVVLALLSAGWAAPLRAQEPAVAPAPKAVYAAESPDRVRAALTEAVVYLRQLARADESNFFVPPVRQRRVVDWKEVEVRYTEKMVDVPVYEAYKTMAVVQTGDSGVDATRELKEVTRHRQVGTKQEKRLIHDPQGSIVRLERHPIYGPGGPDYLFAGFFGQNALVLHALQQCGVRVDDEEFARTARRLVDYADAYGMPDRTWDLAWLTVMVVNLPREDEVHQKLAARLVNKLLLGQIPDGPAAGMWGPVAVHTGLLAQMLRYEQEASKKEIGTWQERLQKKPDDEKLKEKIEAGKAKLKKFQNQYSDITTHGLRFEAVQARLAAPPSEAVQIRAGWSFVEVHLEGLPFNLYEERTADIECTALVLYALTEAARNGYLPDAVNIPKTLEGLPLTPPEKTPTIIQRALDGLSKLAASKDGFSEANFWLPVHDFDFLSLPGLPVDDKTFTIPEPPVTILSIARTHAALAYAGLLPRDARPARVYYQALGVGRKRAVALTEAHLTGEKDIPPVGGVLPPYELAEPLATVFTDLDDPQETHRDLWLRMADQILKTQKPDGSWGQGGLEAYETSLEPYFEEQARRAHQAQQEKLPKDQRKPYETGKRQWRGTPAHYYRFGRSVRADAVATAQAMLLLLEGVRPPVVGVWAWNDQTPPTSVVRTAVNAFSKDKKVPLRYRVLPAGLLLRQVAGLPLLYLIGEGSFAPKEPASLDVFQTFLANKGVAALEMPATTNGIAFFQDARAKLLELLPGAMAGPVPPLYPGAQIQGIMINSNQMAAAFLPVSGERVAPPGALRWPQAAQFTYQLLTQRVDPDIFRPDYPIAWPAVEAAERKEAERKAAEAAGLTPETEEKPAAPEAKPAEGEPPPEKVAEGGADAPKEAPAAPPGEAGEKPAEGEPEKPEEPAAPAEDKPAEKPAPPRIVPSWDTPAPPDTPRKSEKDEKKD